LFCYERLPLYGCKMGAVTEMVEVHAARHGRTLHNDAAPAFWS
jgi:hypothetical protein